MNRGCCNECGYKADYIIDKNNCEANGYKDLNQVPLDKMLCGACYEKTKMTVNNIDYQKLECIHVALQELQQEFNIPDDNTHLEDAFKFVEDIRDKYLKEYEHDTA